MGTTTRRGDAETLGRGEKESNFSSPRLRLPASPRRANGFTLIELVITLTVLTILTLGVIPLVKTSVRRQREQQLREALRQMRGAIDQFHREALAGARTQQQGGQAGAAVPVTPPTETENPTGGAGAGAVPVPGQQAGPQFIDPRVRVAITDNTIFGTDNPDRYPPDLDTLINGVNVTPIGGGADAGGGGIVGLSGSDQTATSNSLTSAKKKVYLREIPVDPMTGERDWELRSTYDSKDAQSWGGENVFDVRSKSTATALDGETKYNEW
ncbi:MAG TPA: prepilin-type N-terminal cleavage/methylation domain-containing protein [Pyrinomonadaceae bacterium]|jgi:general secretion pathway protein G